MALEDNIFDLDDAAQLIDQDLSGAERQERINQELDNAIKKSIMAGEFDIASGAASIFASSDSILSTITDEELSLYLRSRNWKVNLQRCVNIGVQVPTFQYIIDFGEENAENEVIFNIDGKISVSLGNTDSQGRISTDLSEKALTESIHPVNIQDFTFIVKEQLYTIIKQDTNYEYLEVVAQKENLK